MKRIVLMLCALSLPGLLCADVDWPSDFDVKLKETVSAWQPTGSAVGVSATTLAGASVMAGGRGFSAGYGSENEPFDVNWHTFGWDFFEGIFRSTPPSGFTLLIR